MLCVMLVLGMAVAVSAEGEKLDARFLEDKGQQIFCLGDEIATAPVIDGSIQEGEYTVKVETTMDEYGKFNAATGGTWAVEWANYYLAYDAECLYLAAEVYDPDHVPFGTFESNYKRGDQFCMYLGGMKNMGDPEGIGSCLAFRFFDGNREGSQVEGEDWFECQDNELDFFGSYVSGEYYDVNSATKARKVDHSDETNVTTYEVAVKWDFIKSVWPHVENKQYDYLTFGATIQDSSNELIEGQDMGHRTGIRNWGITGQVAEEVYDTLVEQYDSVAFFGQQNERTIPNMIYLGTRDEYEAFKAEMLSLETEPEETEPEETEPEETEPTETEPTETEPTETEPTETEPTETQPTETQPTDKPAEGGCGSSVAAISVALVAILGTCTAFVAKKRD